MNNQTKTDSMDRVIGERLKAKYGPGPRPELVERMKQLPNQRGGFMKWFNSHKWLLVSLISFTCSFFIARFFLQFLCLAVIFGVKWIFDTGSTRTLIMIYEAWKKGDKPATDHLINRLTG